MSRIVCERCRQSFALTARHHCGETWGQQIERRKVEARGRLRKYRARQARKKAGAGA